jgi:hypothetical protein
MGVPTGKVPLKDLLAGRIVDSKRVLLDAADAKVLTTQGDVVGRRRRDRHPGARGIEALELHQLQSKVRDTTRREEPLIIKALFNSKEVKNHMRRPQAQARGTAAADHVHRMRINKGKAERNYARMRCLERHTRERTKSAAATCGYASAVPTCQTALAGQGHSC